MSETIYVWDRFVRFFHWSLVLLFIVSYFSGEEEHWIHVYSGYGIICLVAMRIIWGFIGTKYARFASFVSAPVKGVDYLRALVSGQKPERYIGHNPAGGMMVLAMLITLFFVGFSGLKLYAIEEGKGPFASTGSFNIVLQASADSDDDHEEYERDHDDGYESDEEHEGDEHEDEAEEFWEDVHEASVNFMILLVILHIGGVFLSSRAHGESLVRAMISGRKESD
jgi:cytochrome b